MSTPAAPARIHAILAREAPVAVVFRRGPSKQVQMLAWDLTTDKVTPGQWLKHRVYAEGADLSPDGRHLVYTAASHKPRHGVGNGYVAISKPPFFTALALYPLTWLGGEGGVLLDNRRVWVAASSKARGGEGLLRSNGLDRVSRLPGALAHNSRHDMPCMRRDGWTLADFLNDRQYGPLAARVWTWERPVARGWALRRTITHAFCERRAGLNGNWHWQAHELYGPDGSTDLNTEWADTWQGEVLFARDGCLYRMTPGDAPHLVADLTPNTFRPVRAPYAGVSLARHSRKRWHPLEVTR